MKCLIVSCALMALTALAQSPDAEGVYRIGNGVSMPRILSKREPSYSEEARLAKVNARISLSIVIGTDGVPTSPKIVRGAGFGLDDQAISSVMETWRFEPGKKDGEPVKVRATIEVNFRLLNKDREDQSVRLTFAGSARPTLSKGAMPTNPKTVPAHMQVELTVTSKGEAANFNVLESSDDKWRADVLREMRAWRFHGADADVKGVFDITVGPYKPTARPSTP